VIWISFYHNGKQIRKSTKLPNTRENRKKVERELLPKLNGDDFLSKQTVEYYYKIMMKERELKPSSIRKYASCYTKHIAKFKDRNIDTFKVSELKTWVYSLGVSPKQTKSIVSIFRMIFQEAIYDEAIEKNPFTHIKLPKLIKYEPKPFSRKEVSILINNADGWFKNLLVLLFMTGMRIGEAIALDWDDIDEYICVSKTISEGNIGNTKTDTVRYVPIFDDLKPYIRNQKLLTGLANKKVFVGLKDAKDLHSHWHKLIKKCGIEHRVLYQARHTFAIHALDSGLFKVSQIANILGHTSVQMLFQRYAKFIKSEIDSVPKSFSTLSTKLSTVVA